MADKTNKTETIGAGSLVIDSDIFSSKGDKVEAMKESSKDLSKRTKKEECSETEGIKETKEVVQPVVPATRKLKLKMPITSTDDDQEQEARQNERTTTENLSQELSKTLSTDFENKSEKDVKIVQNTARFGFFAGLPKGGSGAARRGGTKDWSQIRSSQSKIGSTNIPSGTVQTVRDDYKGRMIDPKGRSGRPFNGREMLELDQEVTIDESKVLSMTDLRRKGSKELVEIAEQYGVTNIDRVLKHDVIWQISANAFAEGYSIYCEGCIEVLQDGLGFLRYSENHYATSSDNIYISQAQVKRYGLRTGDDVACYVRPPRKGVEKYFAAIKIVRVNEADPDAHKARVHFDNLVPLFPKEKLNLDTNLGSRGDDVSARVVDVTTPIGKGQRCLIVAPPRTGKTVLMQNIAHAITAKHKEIVLIVLLIDERPEELTDMRRSVNGEVVSSTFDEPPERHVALADFVVEKAKRLVENGKDVVILLDSITRLARAYNTVAPSSGRVLSGGLDANALQRPKRFFGAARNIENGGSLTIIATALVDTGSRMDEVIFEEFKGTGNSEIVLDRSVADKRYFPAINVAKSGTRKEDEMIDPETLAKRWALRRIITRMGDQAGSSGGAEALEFLVKELKKTSNNIEFFTKMNGMPT